MSRLGLGLGLDLGIPGVNSASSLGLLSVNDTSRLAILPHLLNSLWQESGSADDPKTHVSAIDDFVGQIDDQGTCNNEVVTPSASRPTFGYDINRGAYLGFGSPRFLIANNSKNSYNEIHTGGAFTIAMWAAVGTNATVEVLLDSCNVTGGNVGFYLFRNASNKIQFGSGNGVPGSPYAYTSSGNFRTNEGWMPIIISADGTNGNMYLGSAAAEPFSKGAASHAAAGTLSSFDLRIGASQTPSLYWTGLMGPIIISPFVWDATQRAEFRNYNPSRNSYSLFRRLATNGNPQDYNYLHGWWDAQGTNYLYQGVGRTSSVTADGQDIRTVATRAPSNVYRDLSGAGAANTYPKYKPTLADGLGGMKFDGVDDVLTFLGVWPRAGDFHAFIVAQNNDLSAGSHYWSVAGGYLAETGANYVGGYPSPYAVNHTTGGFAAGGNIIQNGGSRNVIEVKRTGGYVYVRVNGVGTYAQGDFMNLPSYNNYNSMGPVGHGDNAWWLDGIVGELVLYTTILPEWAANKVVGYLGGKWLINNLGVPFGG